MDNDRIKAAWAKYDAGQSVSDQELEAMIKQMEQALEYFHARGASYYLARIETIGKLTAFEGYRTARRSRF